MGKIFVHDDDSESYKLHVIIENWRVYGKKAVLLSCNSE